MHSALCLPQNCRRCQDLSIYITHDLPSLPLDSTMKKRNFSGGTVLSILSLWLYLMVVIFTHWWRSLINIAHGKSFLISFQPNKQNYQNVAIALTLHRKYSCDMKKNVYDFSATGVWIRVARAQIPFSVGGMRNVLACHINHLEIQLSKDR